MSARTLTMTDLLYDYLLSVNRPLPDLFARLRAETSQLPMAGMQISVEQGRFMELVTKLNELLQKNENETASEIVRKTPVYDHRA